MSRCQFHPLKAPTWHCQNCVYDLCDDCIDEGQYNNDPRCMACNSPVESLGATHSAVPFWRRLKESFRYPLRGDAIGLIIGAALLDSAMSYIPTGFILQILLTGLVFSYCFECMKETANGNMLAPGIQQAYGKSMQIMGKLYLIMAILVIAGLATFRFMGEALGALISTLLLFSAPAIIILYGLSESVIEAINPKSVINMVNTIGMPYGLIICFIMIMASSVDVIHEVLGNFDFLSSTLQSMTSNYYMVVMFHIMGYMIFQNQAEFGYTADEDHGNPAAARHLIDRQKSRIRVLIKEGRFEEAIRAYEESIRANADDKQLVEDCFNLLVSLEHKDYLADFASFYLEFLQKIQRADQMVSIFKRVVTIAPDYMPDTAELRHTLAHSLQQRGDFKTAIKLLNGLHTAFPTYTRLPQAYLLMAECLETQPGMNAHAAKYRTFAEKLNLKATAEIQN